MNASDGTYGSFICIRMGRAGFSSRKNSPGKENIIRWREVFTVLARSQTDFG
ncbi:hypothetical protein lbkm_1524 [Lachnospiraceae bacterium KM106-2]|nr:hypothetical protein lbkm_1524 [Lachnospiraceae bacterium KM106-2]